LADHSKQQQGAHPAMMALKETGLAGLMIG
jgi:hypothetical protein